MKVGQEGYFHCLASTQYIFASIISGIGMALIPMFPTFTNFLIFGTMAGLGYGIYFSVSKALASDMSPIDSSGRYMAIYNIAVGGSAAVSPFLFGAILNHFNADPIFGFTVLFETTALFYIISIFFLLPLRSIGGYKASSVPGV